jgi:hypothetical protein
MVQNVPQISEFDWARFSAGNPLKRSFPRKGCSHRVHTQGTLSLHVENWRNCYINDSNNLGDLSLSGQDLVEVAALLGVREVIKPE